MSQLNYVDNLRIIIILINCEADKTCLLLPRPIIVISDEILFPTINLQVIRSVFHISAASYFER